MNRKLFLIFHTWSVTIGIVLVVVALLFVLFGQMDWDCLLIPVPMLLLIIGNSIGKKKDNFINTNANPFIPIGLELVSHQKNGIIEYFEDMVSPVSIISIGDISVTGNILDGYKNNRLANANVLDWFIGHPKFIPDILIDKKLLFLGTIYTDQKGVFYVRFLECHSHTWRRNFCRLEKGENNYNDYYVAIL